MKCETCHKEIEPNCDWNQGRCPHRGNYSDYLFNSYNARFLNLFNFIKGLFK